MSGSSYLGAFAQRNFRRMNTKSLTRFSVQNLCKWSMVYLHKEQLLQSCLLNKFFANMYILSSQYLFYSGTVTREVI